MDCSTSSWHHHLAYLLAASAVGYAVYLRYQLSKSQINHEVQKGSPKVVHIFDSQELEQKSAFCRCWNSKKFPYCDGSHNDHNTKTGDNIGPLIIEKKSA